MPTQRVPFIFTFSAPAPCIPLQQLQARWLILFGNYLVSYPSVCFCCGIFWNIFFFSLVYRDMCIKPKTLCLIEESILWPAWINLSCISCPLNISGISVDFHDCVYYNLLQIVYVLPIRWAAAWGQNQYSFYIYLYLFIWLHWVLVVAHGIVDLYWSMWDLIP